MLTMLRVMLLAVCLLLSSSFAPQAQEPTLINGRPPLTFQDSMLVYTKCYAELFGIGSPQQEVLVAFQSSNTMWAWTKRTGEKQWTIWFDDKSLRETDDFFRRSVVVHELSHVKMWPLLEPLYLFSPTMMVRLEEQFIGSIEQHAVWLRYCNIVSPKED